MRILWLKTDLLLPLDKGGRLRTWHLMRHLARRHEITYVAFASPGEDPRHIAGMREVAASVETIPRLEVQKASPRFFANVAWHLADPLPYAVGQYRSRQYRRTVERLLATNQFDLVVSDFLPPIVNLPSDLPCPAVLFTHNVESEIWRRHAETATGTIRRFLYGTQYRRMLAFEGQALRRFDGLLAVSDADRETFARLYPGVDAREIHVVRTGVDTDYFAPAPSAPDSVELVFTGSMDWLPNEDGMLWFCREILPLVHAQMPAVTVSIVGRAPTPAVKKLAEQRGVRVTGRVDDVRPYMSEAAVFVVPLRIGGGTRLKIFEAMAMAKAVVSTTVGAEGLPVTHGRDVVLADSVEHFADAVLHLIRDVSARRQLESAGRALVAEHFDWSAVARDLDHALSQSASGFTVHSSRVSRHSSRVNEFHGSPKLRGRAL
jgi:sugar transferase (PEP-CTERM/EpsH1 system associated)